MTSPETSKTAFTKEEEEKICHQSDLLHLFYHRNNNQHRRSIWWRHLRIFRKQLNALLATVKELNEVPSTHVARTKKKVRDPQLRILLQQRLHSWQDVVVPKWQHAFSQLSADGRFGVLGLMLLASLAEVCAITGITAGFEDLGQVEVERALHRFADEGWDENGSLVHYYGEDVGELVQRDHLRSNGSDTAVSSENLGLRAATRPGSTISDASKALPAAKLMKKKRKKGDAIDDLFSGLG